MYDQKHRKSKSQGDKETSVTSATPGGDLCRKHHHMTTVPTDEQTEGGMQPVAAMDCRQFDSHTFWLQCKLNSLYSAKQSGTRSFHQRLTQKSF